MPLPSTRELAEQLGFNHATVVRACNGLIAAGILHRKGYKTTVGPGSPTFPMLQGTIEVVSYLEGFTRATIRILGEFRIAYRVTDLSFSRHPHPAPLLKKIFARRPSGVILCAPAIDDDLKVLLDSTEIPFVLYAEGARDPSRSFTQVDRYRGTEKALQHLYALGHRHIAHVSFADGMYEIAKYHRTVCLELNLKASASLIWRPEVREFEDVRDTLQERLRRHPEVTALTCEVQVGNFAKRFLSIPQDISVIAFGAESEEPDHQTTLTTVEDPPFGCFALWACADIISQGQIQQSGHLAKGPTHALFVPKLVARESTRALVAPVILSQASGQTSAPKPDAWDTWRNTYPSLRKTRTHNWLQLDLSKLANHSITRHHGWLGSEPLEYFPPGLRSIHGVPFRVLDEERNGGRAVITFRSIHSHSAEGKQLPVRTRIRVDSRVSALYFLHGCGHARPLPFARYVMHYEQGEPVSMALVPLGISRRLAAKRLGSLKPNVQDWWPDFEQTDFPHAHRAAVFNPAEPAAYQRFIYSLEWINPRPTEEVLSIAVQVDPGAGPTLALLAVTALL